MRASFGMDEKLINLLLFSCAACCCCLLLLLLLWVCTLSPPSLVCCASDSKPRALRVASDAPYLWRRPLPPFRPTAVSVCTSPPCSVSFRGESNTPTRIARCLCQGFAFVASVGICRHLSLLPAATTDVCSVCALLLHVSQLLQLAVSCVCCLFAAAVLAVSVCWSSCGAQMVWVCRLLFARSEFRVDKSHLLSLIHI